MRSEMTWSERPAQSSSAVWRLFHPRPLMMEPEKSEIISHLPCEPTSIEDLLVKTPLGTEEPNMASVRSQFLGS